LAVGDTIDSGSIGATKITSASAAYIDVTKMETNHPVGVAKPAAKTGFTGFKATDTNTGVWYRKSSDTTEYVACQSCHNPHLTTNAPFLRIANTGSAICKSCHDL
jgi:predicted CXXCH cytochrome family protein